MRNIVWAFSISALAMLGIEQPIAQQPSRALLTHSVLHAHNCYPEHGRFDDRLSRAIGTGLRPVAIEQDLVWSAQGVAGGRSVVSHGEPLTGQEPTLEDHFFKRVATMLDDALATNRRSEWPLLILHLDFKTNEVEHHRAVWELLGKYERWLTTAERGGDPTVPMPLHVGPLLVLTENGEGQSVTFHDRVAVGQKLRLFGTMPSAIPDLSTLSRQQQLEHLASASPEMLIPASATNYRRWTNHPWAVVEHGGQAMAGEWTSAEDQRLVSLVQRARAMNLWLRFYALNGHKPDVDQGWSAGYNFGSLESAQRRWDAAIAAGVDLVATDQYEMFAARVKRSTREPRRERD